MIFTRDHRPYSLSDGCILANSFNLDNAEINLDSVQPELNLNENVTSQIVQHLKLSRLIKTSRRLKLHVSALMARSWIHANLSRSTVPFQARAVTLQYLLALWVGRSPPVVASPQIFLPRRRNLNSLVVESRSRLSPPSSRSSTWRLLKLPPSNEKCFKDDVQLSQDYSQVKEQRQRQSQRELRKRPRNPDPRFRRSLTHWYGYVQQNEGHEVTFRGSYC